MGRQNRIELPCARCEGRGYSRFGSSIELCPKCEGSGDQYAKPSPILAEFIDRSRRLEVELREVRIDYDCLADRVRELSRNKRDPSVTLFCSSCGGKGLQPTEKKWDSSNLSIRRCVTCLGTGVDASSRVPSIVHRLWYEVDRLQEVISRKFHEWEKKAPPPASHAVAIEDRSVWLFVLGLNGSPTREEIRKAYKKRAAETHPDVGGTKEAFTVVQLAHEKLLEMS